MEHDIRAAELFCSGYNCAQAVAAAFSNVTGLSVQQSSRLVSGFGGGFGRQREVCGAVSGMTMVVSLLYGYDAPDAEKQMQTYALIQKLCSEFAAEAGSIICRDILKNPPSDPKPTARTAEYYAQRPCARMVMLAAQILDRYIAENPPIK